MKAEEEGPSPLACPNQFEFQFGDSAMRLAPASRGKAMGPRLLLIAASLVLFPLALISEEAMALDVQQSCEGDFRRYCGSYKAYSTSGNACMTRTDLAQFSRGMPAKRSSPAATLPELITQVPTGRRERADKGLVQ